MSNKVSQRDKAILEAIDFVYDHWTPLENCNCKACRVLRALHEAGVWTEKHHAPTTTRKKTVGND